MSTAAALLSLLPPHKCGLFLTHNEHRDYYEPLGDFIAGINLAPDFVSGEEREKALETDEVWVLQWYPETPVGFHRLAASSLEALLAKLKEQG